MSDDEIYDVDEDEIDTDMPELDEIVERAKNKNVRALDARRQIERIMEIRRLKELDEDIDWENID
jgi:hypothetical protein